MQPLHNDIRNTEEDLFSSLMFKYMPFWPLFIGLALLSLVGTYVYVRYYYKPVYEVSATLVIKDENKGVQAPSITQMTDIFSANKIVENETNVIRSRTLVRKVVENLHLYAPVFEEGNVKSMPAYTKSPVVVQLAEPDAAKEVEKVYFTFNAEMHRVTIDSVSYPLHTWVETPYGTMRFAINAKNTRKPEGKLYFSIVSPKKITDDLLGRLEITPSSKLSSVVNLVLKDQEPRRGEDILNALMMAYHQAAVSERNELAASTMNFIEDRIRAVAVELDEVEKEIQEYKSTKGVVNLSEQGRQFLQNVSEIDQKMADINLQLAVLQKVEDYVVAKQGAEGIVPSTLGVSDQVLAQLLQKLYDTEIQYYKLKKTTAENNPILISIAEEIERIRPSILENIRNQRDNLLASRMNLSTTNSMYRTALQSIPVKERELLEISRKQIIKNNAYSFLLQKREETALSHAPAIAESRVIDKAEASVHPVNLKPLHLYLIAIMMAFVSGVGLINGKELLNGKLLYRSEIEKYTKAPVVAELAYVKEQKGDYFNAPTAVQLTEQFRQLRSALGVYGRIVTRKKIMVTSSITGEGKSFVSTNLAYCLAATGKKVVLVDFDLRSPGTSKLFNQYQQTGLTEFLSGDLPLDGIVKETYFQNLHLIPAGERVGDHSDHLLSNKLDNFFKLLEENFDFIIVDTPPVELVTDAFLLSEYCDTTLLVMRHDYTPKTIVQRLGQYDNQAKIHSKVLIVFNGVKPRGFVRGNYGYGYGYGYENKYGDNIYKNRAAGKSS